MSHSSSFPRYPRLLQMLHWTIGLAVLCQLAIVLVLGQLRSLGYGQTVLAAHRQLGFAILLLSLARLGLLLRHRVPSLDRDLPPWQLLAARGVHIGFYVALIIQPVLGMLIAWARGDVVSAFGLITIPAPWDLSDTARDRCMTAHIATAVALVALLVVHIGAVVFNHWRRGVPVLERMLPEVPPDRLVNRVPVVIQLTGALGFIVIISTAIGINAIMKYRAFSEMSAAYQETDQAAADDAHAAQVAWKELLGLTAAEGSKPEVGREEKLAATALGHMTDAVGHSADPTLHASIAALAAQLGQLHAKPPPYPREDIHTIDTHLEDCIDGLAAAAQQAQGESAERASRGHDLIVVTVAPMALLGILVALLMARSMASSLGRMQALVRGVGMDSGSGSIEVSGRGEFASLMRSMLDMRAGVERRMRLAADERLALESDRARAEEEEQERLRKADLQRAADHQAMQRAAELHQQAQSQSMREELAAEFESQVAGIIDTVAATVITLKTTAATLAQSAATTTRCSSDASVVANSTRESASRIAGSSAELSQAAQSVRHHAEESKGRALVGAREASAARAEMDLLAVASKEIGTITEIISGVARQTNLLAINARIEAARAGDAGRGFCIVADEVKTLAGKTQSATEGIGGQVSQVTVAAGRSIDLIQNMRAIIADLETNSSSIFSACDDQSKSTEDIASKVAQISASTASVADNIEQAERTARATEAMAADVVDTAVLLETQANALQDQVANFVLQLTSIGGAASASGTVRRAAPRAQRVGAAGRG